MNFETGKLYQLTDGYYCDVCFDTKYRPYFVVDFSSEYMLFLDGSDLDRQLETGDILLCVKTSKDKQRCAVFNSRNKLYYTIIYGEEFKHVMKEI